METGEKRSFWWAVGSLIFGLVFGYCFISFGSGAVK